MKLQIIYVKHLVINVMKKITDNIQLIKAHTKSLTDSYIDGLEAGSIILGYLDLIELVTIQKIIYWKNYLNNSLNKITALCKDQNNWKNEDDILQLFRSDNKGDRFFLTGKVTLHTLKLLIDSDLKLIK